MKAGKKVAFILLLFSLFFVVGCKRNFEVVIVDSEDITESVKEYDSLGSSGAAKFSFADLKIASLTYLTDENSVIAAFGMPQSVVNTDIEKTGIDQKRYSYDGLVLTFTMIDGKYLLTGAEANKEIYTFSRGLKPGDKLDDILDLYYREPDCLNDNYYAPDKVTILGKHLYGSITVELLENVKTSGKIETGIINLNGYSSLEDADSYIVEYTYFEPPYISGTADVCDDFAQIAFDVDNTGIITSIRWFYYPEEK